MMSSVSRKPKRRTPETLTALSPRTRSPCETANRSARATWSERFTVGKGTCRTWETEASPGSSVFADVADDLHFRWHVLDEREVSNGVAVEDHGPCLDLLRDGKGVGEEQRDKRTLAGAAGLPSGTP